MYKQNGKRKQLQRVLQRSVAIVLLFAVAFMLYMYLFPHHKTIYEIIEDESIEINRESLKGIVYDEDYRLYAAISKNKNEEIQFISIKDNDLEKIEKLIGDNDLLQWVYSLNLNDGTKNILFGRINTNNYKSVEIKGVPNNEINYLTYNNQTYFWVEANLELPIDIKLYDEFGNVVFSNMDGIGVENPLK
ncbi:hypothetical protein [Marinicrinis lubricantis]|uniref:Uncharacterized protein n=1 Tax=Marinicrinis lubricantis TaxID=2086470 RepID=A0ABW1IJZ6_9BACL